MPRVDTETAGTFPPSPIDGSTRLVPIRSWPEMFRETQVTGVEFDEFWYESVEEGVAYFFSWVDIPRATVLVVWNGDGPNHIECRGIGDQLLSTEQSALIEAEVTQLFRNAGFWSGEPAH